MGLIIAQLLTGLANAAALFLVASGLAPHQVARLGLGYVPEERRIFTDLTILENLEVGKQPARDGRDPWTPRVIV